ncbi:MAG TPA: NmrA family NAD(P)-binding protein, partial [Longimicrobiales bacterium]|nr:NmrA family NAD(P)-binding protein [Longimicrobiales bacterium]
VVRGDFADPASLEDALSGVWGVLSIQNSWESGVEREEAYGKLLARLARDAGVSHFVYQSVASANRRTGIPHFESKFHIEETVRALGFPSFVIIRPVFFMENFLRMKAAIAGGLLPLGLEPDTRLQMIAVEDIGRIGCLAFERHDAMNGRAIDIAGDELTIPEAARALSRVTGRNVIFQRVPIEQIRAASEDQAAMLEWFDAVGYDVDIPAIEREFGSMMRFADWAARQDWSS